MRNTPLLQNNLEIYYINNNTNIGEYYLQENNNNPSNSFILLILTLIAILGLNFGWYYGILIIIISFTPGMIIIYQFKKQIIQEEISIKTITDLFTFGAVISVTITLIIEGFFFTWIFSIKNNQYNYIIHQFGCNLGFPLYILIIILKYIISIGIIEEACKLIGLFTIKTYIQDIHYKESFISHYLNSNIGYVIAGISNSLGFAIIENISYISNSMENILLMLIVGISRALISIPFHIFTSGFTSILLSQQYYKENYLHINNNSTIYSQLYLLKEIVNKFIFLIPAGILHGIYDSSLIILALLSQDEHKDQFFESNSSIIYNFIKLLLLLFTNSKKPNFIENQFNTCFGPFYNHLIILGFFIIAIISYFICFFLFIYNWIHLERRTCNRRIIHTQQDSNNNEFELSMRI